MTEQELDKLPDSLLGVKCAIGAFTLTRDETMDKYISPPKGYLFGEDVSLEAYGD